MIVLISWLCLPLPARALLEGVTRFNILRPESVPAPKPIPEASKADAAYNLGVKYYGTNPGEAMAWFRRAAALGSAKAQYRLGVAYEAGIGVTADAAQAFGWYGRAAKLGDDDAACALGAMYAAGSGTAQSGASAAKWLEPAAKRGCLRGQYWLGMLYKSGLGVAKDAVEAYFWFSIAARQADAALTERDAVAPLLDDAQLRAVRKRLKEWKGENDVTEDAPAEDGILDETGADAPPPPPP